MAANEPRWRVDSQQETRRPTATGQFVNGFLVFFTALQSGTQASVFVPNSDYAPDKVRAMISDRAAQIDAIHGLSG